MTNAEQHLHRMAKNHHATMKKLDGMRERFSGLAQRGIGTVEMGAGAWLGGMLEGRTAGKALGPIPLNLGVGIIMLGASAFDMAGHQWSEHLANVGNGFVGSYLAATGYAFGKRWRETGKVFGGGGHPWTHPYDSGWPAPSAEAPPPAAPPPAVHGDLTQEQMNAIMARMTSASHAAAR